MTLFDFFRRKRVAVPESAAVTTTPVDRRRGPRTMIPAGTKVLIVDDSKTMVAALSRMLRENHFTTLEAYDGAAALEILRVSRPDLIFLDIVMPGLSGFDVLRRIRRSQDVGTVPVIVMSGNEAATEEYYVRRIGADDFMRKPCSRAEVFSRVERLLGLKPNALDKDAVAGRKALLSD